MDPNDDGNWTGGKVGLGELKGTKFGISAAAYPLLDIPSLSMDQATAIYCRDYWDKMYLDSLPPRVAVVVLDSAINQGTDTAAKLLQKALGFKDTDIDGVIGPHTIAAARGVDQDTLVPAFLSVRAMRYTELKKWPTFGKGWMSRLFLVSQECSRA
jgi:lysozyme family protein